MRKTIQTTPPPNTGCISDPAVSGYDWSRLGLHTFRVSAGTIIDFPLPIGASSQAWIASLWPDARIPTGWGGWAWQPDPVQGRGWLLPERLMCGDVLEFAVDQPDPSGVDGGAAMVGHLRCLQRRLAPDYPRAVRDSC